MKKVVLLFSMMALMSTVRAYDFYVFPLYYNIIDNNNVEVAASPYSDSYVSGTCNIPSNVTYNGTTYTVIGIGSNAFIWCVHLTTIYIPSTITYMGQNAFFACQDLVTTHFSGTIGQWCGITFANESSNPLAVSSRPHSASLYIGGTNITNLVIPDSITNIGNYTFYGLTGLTSVSFHNSLTCIGDGAFCGCTGLGTIMIPTSVTSIGTNAFALCSGLVAVVIPSSVTSIGDYAFGGVNVIAYNGSATGRPWGANHAYYNDGDFIFEDSLQTILYKYIGSMSAVNIPNTVTQIADMAFYNCTNLSSVSFPNTLNSIGNVSFFGCTGLSTITIPESVTNIGFQAFDYCDNLYIAYFTGLIPPTLGSNAFGDNVSIGIPCGTYSLYYSSFGNRTFIEPNSEIELTLSANNNSWGDASCIQVPPMYSDVRCDSTAVIQATANYGYHFDHWSTGSTQSPDTVHLTGDSTIIAYFAKNQYTVTGLTNQSDRGNVVGSATADYLDNVTLTATATYGYHFSHWSDGSMENPHQVTATQDMTVYAYFEPNQYAINVESADDTMGYVSGGGSYDYLSNRTISATPNYGYHFVQWNDGVSTSSRSVTLTQDTTFTAYFAANQYTLTVVSADETMGTVSGGGTFDYGNTVTITATPMEHYHFVRWNDGSTENPRNIEITQDRTITAFFAIDVHHVEVTSGDITRGAVTGGGDFEYGTAITVSATAYSGYQFVRWSNGVSYNPYTFAVTTDMELTAIFIEEGTVYNVTAAAADPTMGTVTGGGPYGVGEEAVLTAIPNDGYRFDHWEDGSYQNPRTVTVTADASYVAYFVPTQSISDVQDVEALIYARGGRIIVENVNGMVVRVYDMMGRLVATASGETVSVPMPVGVYLVKVGTLPARKVVVIR